MGLLLHAYFSSCDIVLKTGIHTLGGARNLKLGEQRGKGARTKAQGAIFFCMGQIFTLFSCCVHQKDVVESRGRREAFAPLPMLKHF